MARWEYHFVSGSLDANKKHGQQFLSDLNGLGRQGWEVVGTVGGAMGAATMILKRQLPG